MINYIDVFELGGFKIIKTEYSTYYEDGDEIPLDERLKPELDISVKDDNNNDVNECDISRDDAIELVKVLNVFIEETKPIR